MRDRESYFIFVLVIMIFVSIVSTVVDFISLALEASIGAGWLVKAV